MIVSLRLLPDSLSVITQKQCYMLYRDNEPMTMHAIRSWCFRRIV